MCGQSVIGSVGLTDVAFAQPWWISGGTTGTLVYNTSLAESLGFLTGAAQGHGGDLLDYGWMAVVEGGQAYVLDGLDAQYASSTIHIRAIPAAGVYGAGFQFETTVANNVLLWEGQIAAVASTAERRSSFGEFGGNRGGNNSNSAQTINGKGGRFLVSGLNLFILGFRLRTVQQNNVLFGRGGGETAAIRCPCLIATMPIIWMKNQRHDVARTQFHVFRLRAFERDDVVKRARVTTQQTARGRGHGAESTKPLRRKVADGAAKKDEATRQCPRADSR